MNIGHKIVYLDSVNSTNNYVANLVKSSKIDHGTAIMADVQTAGKGQRGAVWHAEAGENILLSLFLKPDKLSVSQQVLLTFFAANSIREVLRKIGISATIKWPNDIYVGNKKIAGILIENSISNNHVVHSILGIGLNVNQLNFEGVNATSVQLEMNEYFQRNELLFMLLHQLNKNWELLTQQSPKLKAEYLENLFRIHQRSAFKIGEMEIEGTITGIDENGLLIVEINGEKELFDLKEISFIL
ncbi:MAG: biotin--[acetyl-CoA-carboxylase] ligase [Crocinitomicaceae bacterium]|nr:biotin--[acetyl-CoA-carboxylase] ligase [Crocinitomicaceae bacterium]